MRILSVDQARSGGWSVFEYETKELVAYGTFEFDSKNYTYAQAIMNIERVVWEVIVEQDIQVVFLEDIQLRANVQSFKRLAQLQGVLVNLLEKNEYLYDYIAPTKWQNYCMARSRNSVERKSDVKKVVLDGKKNSKVLSIQFVHDQFGITTDNDNLADAICIGWYAVNEIKIENHRVEE